MPLRQKAIHTAAVAWRERPRFFNNPIILRELVTQLRKTQSFLCLFLFMFISTLLLTSWWNQLTWRASMNYQNPARDFFMMFSMTVGAIVVLIVPLFSATSVNVEIERETWDLIKTTPISLSSILLGKFLSSIFLLWLILLSLIPIFSIIFPLGGVSPQEILVFYLIASEGLVIAALIGLICSIRFKRAITSISMTYVFCLLYFLVLPFGRTFLIGRVFLVEWLFSPFMVSTAFFSSQSIGSVLPSQRMFTPSRTLRGWTNIELIFAHYLVVSAVIVLLLLICAWLYFPSMKGNIDKVLIRIYRWINRFTQLKPILIFLLFLGGVLTLLSLQYDYSGLIVAFFQNLDQSFASVSSLFYFFFVLFFWFYVPARYGQEWREQNWNELETTPQNLRRFLFGKFVPPLKKLATLGLLFVPYYICLLFHSPSHFFDIGFTWFLFAQEVLIITAIGLYCSLKWDNLLLGSIYTSIQTVVLHVVFILFSPLTIFVLFVTNFNLDYYSSWFARYFYLIIAGVIATIVILVFLILLCQREILIRSKQFERESLWKWFKRTLMNVIPERKHTPDPKPTEFYPDDKNPLWIKGLRTFYTYNRSRFCWTLGYLFLGSLFIYFFIGSNNQFQINQFRHAIYPEWRMFSILLLYLIPFIILPYTTDSFRGEKDRSTWDLLRTTTLTPAKLLNGKLWVGLWLFSCRFWAFFGLAFLLGHCFRFVCEPEHTEAIPWLDGYVWNTVLIGYSYGILLLIAGVYFSIRLKKSTTVFTASVGAALFILWGGYLANFLGIYRGMSTGLFSPLFLLSNHGAISTRYIQSHDWWQSMRTCYVALSLLAAYLIYRLTLSRIRVYDK